jgi:hypothetical protein
MGDLHLIVCSGQCCIFLKEPTNEGQGSASATYPVAPHHWECQLLFAFGIRMGQKLVIT